MSLPIHGDNILSKTLNGGHCYGRIFPFTSPSRKDELLGFVSGRFILNVSGISDGNTNQVFQPKNDILITDIYGRNVTPAMTMGTVALYLVPITGFDDKITISSIVFTGAAGEVSRATQIYNTSPLLPGCIIPGMSENARIMAVSADIDGPVDIFFKFINIF